MSTAFRAMIGASMLVSSTLAAQGSRADSRPLQIDTLVGDISATLMPSETPLDSTAAEDLAILRRVVADPHAIAQADSSGRFRFAAVPAGTYWIEAESMQGSAIVQWWEPLSMEPADFALVRILGKRDMIFSVSLATKNFTHDQFCTGGETPIGATEFAEAIPTPEMLSPAPDGAYRHVDQPASIIDEHLQPTYPEALRKRGESGSVDVRFVIDSTGRIDMRTVRVIRSTDPEFTNAVMRVLPSLRFNPALVSGHPVRWATAQQFNFGINAPQFRSLP